MSADRLRAAAAECRRVPGQITHEDDVQQALADWLDQTAVEWEIWGEDDRNIDKALIVADRILGSETSSTDVDRRVIEGTVVGEFCGATQARCHCFKPVGHVAAGDDVHACDMRMCGGSWTGDGESFMPVTFPDPARRWRR